MITCTGDPDEEAAMGDTGTDHTKPENIHRIEGVAYRTDNHEEVIVQDGTGWALYRRVAVLGTRREAAELAAEPTRRVTLA